MSGNFFWGVIFGWCLYYVVREIVLSIKAWRG